MATDDLGTRQSTADADDADLEAWLARLADRLEVDRERRREVIDEIRSHVLDAADGFEARGLDRAVSRQRAWANLGPEAQVADAINRAHAGHGTAEAIWVAAMPVLLSLVLRWSVLTWDGRPPDWSHLARTAPFWLFAVSALLAPAVRVPRRRFAVASWAVFWSLTVLSLAAR